LISFRFHLVSITAVFLAIAIGVVIGSTFVDRAIVDGLQSRIDSVSNSLDDRRAELSQLRDERAQDEEFTLASADFMLANRLSGRPLLVVAQRGVDEDDVRELVEMARRAGAVAPGVVWVEPRWGQNDSARVDELARMLGVTASTPDRIRARAWREALTDLRRSSTVSPDRPQIMSQLADAGFVSFEAVGSNASLAQLAGATPTVITVTGPEVDEAMRPLLAPMVATAVELDLPVVAAEDWAETGDDDDPGPSRGETVVAAVSDHADAVSVVDHLDLVQGRIAAVLAAADLLDDVTGHYGYGAGAGSALPPWSPR
jgi:Copper transport outer membrane protein, MctB